MNIITKPNKCTLEIGGKANNLLLLEELNLNVPQWVVIPSTILENIVSTELDSQRWNEAIDNLELPLSTFDEMKKFFGAEYRQLNYAIRSSALGEDGLEHSFAGQYTTLLNVSFKGLTEAVKAVWKSIKTENLQAYKKQMDISSQEGIAVIIQEMVPSEVSGVAFGQHPVTGDKNKKVISSVYGLGEGVVSGELNADNYLISDQGIESQITKKEKSVRASKYQDGVTQQPISSELKNQSSLNTEQLIEINDLLNKLNA